VCGSLGYFGVDLCLFNCKKENSDIEMIYLNCGSTEETKDWKGNAFGKMRNLKTLIIDSDNSFEGSIQFPSKLKVLQWKNYHSKSLPSTIVSKVC
jgi:hypothetical protein